MQTALTPAIKDTDLGREADAILRSCVHCGFCNATCPTYQLLGDELDGPRGRIYLIKQLLEGGDVGVSTRVHLDRCLTCLACETTCPSGVQYHRLLDIGRHLVERELPRPWWQRTLRYVLRQSLRESARVKPFVALGRLVRPLLPSRLQRQLPSDTSTRVPAVTQHPRKVLLLEGCVQPALAPSINVATARVLDRLGIGIVAAPRAGCCGALSHHLAANAEALQHARRNVDAWWPHIEAGAEAIVITASGCGTQVKEYGHLLSADAHYAAKAARVSALAKDISEVLAQSDLTAFTRPRAQKIAFHAPCSLQHGQRLSGTVERILQRCGFQLTPVADAHLCCGSAGTYSILQPELSQRLLKNKVAALERHAPDIVATANIGCLTHLAGGSQRPVRHWIELLDE